MATYDKGEIIKSENTDFEDLRQLIRKEFLRRNKGAGNSSLWRQDNKWKYLNKFHMVLGDEINDASTWEANTSNPEGQDNLKESLGENIKFLDVHTDENNITQNILSTGHAARTLNPMAGLLINNSPEKEYYKYDIIPALTEYYRIVNDWAACPDTTDGHGCNAACSGLCSGAAESRSSDGAMPPGQNGPSDYGTGSISGCRSCGGGCDTGCTGTCSEESACGAGATTGSNLCGDVGNCLGTCFNGCSEGCQGGCNSGCTGFCEGCTNCAGNCQASCGGGCSSTCAYQCGAQCSNNCSNQCRACVGYCGSGCTGGCNTTCTGGCSQECKGICGVACEGTCQYGCIGQDDADTSIPTGCNGCDSGCNGCQGHCTSCVNNCNVGCAESCTWNCTGSSAKEAKP